jgi:phosphoserine phosphatase
LWVEKGITKKEFMEVIKTLRPMPGAAETLHELKRRGCKLAVISGGIDTVLNHFFPEAGKLFDHIMINRISFDREGRIEGIEPTDFGADRHKIDGLREIAGKEGIGLEECVFVGDSDNDLDIARGAGLSIAFMPSGELEHASDVVIRKKDLREILKHIIPEYLPG